MQTDMCAIDAYERKQRNECLGRRRPIKYSRKFNWVSICSNDDIVSNTTEIFTENN